MSGLKTRLKAFFGFFLSHPVSVSNALWLAVTGGLEQAMEEIAFKCPEKESKVKLYSGVFFVGSTMALLLMGMLCSNKAWRLCQGLNSRKEPSECDWCKPCCGNLVIVFFKALVLPLTWTLVALMDGDIFACFFYLDECPPGTSPESAEYMGCVIDPEAWEKLNKRESQMWGWGFLAVCLLLALIVVSCNRYRSSRTYFPHLYGRKLKRKERMIIEKLLQEQAEKDAERNVGALMMEYKKFSATKWESICREATKKECETSTNAGTSGTEAGNGEEATGSGTVTNKDDGTKKSTKKVKDPVQYHSPLSEFLSKPENKDLLVRYDAEREKLLKGTQKQSTAGTTASDQPVADEDQTGVSLAQNADQQP